MNGRSPNDDPLSEIVESEGFREVAYAIRQSTVIAQYKTQAWKKKGKRYPYEIRYGLAQQLLRRARQKEGFVADLTNFLGKYLAETSQVEEIMRKSGVKFPFPGQRRRLSERSLDELVYLIDKHGSEVVANLLIAYGYARVPREESKPTDQTSIEEEIA